MFDSSADIGRGDGKEGEVNETPDYQSREDSCDCNANSQSVEAGTLSSEASEERFLTWQREGGRKIQGSSEEKQHAVNM